MDALRRDDLERARTTSPEVKLRQTLDLMTTGFRLKRAALRSQHPEESDAQIEERFRRWLQRDE